MSNNALFTIEQVDNKLIITVEAVKVEQTDSPDSRPMNADEIAQWARTTDDYGLSKKIQQLVQYELNKAKR